MKCILITVSLTLNLFANLITHLLPYKPPSQIHIIFFFLLEYSLSLSGVTCETMGLELSVGSCRDLQ